MIFAHMCIVDKFWDCCENCNVKRNRTEPKKKQCVLVWRLKETKENELKDFPGVNTPLIGSLSLSLSLSLSRSLSLFEGDFIGNTYALFSFFFSNFVVDVIANSVQKQNIFNSLFSHF